MDGYSSGNFERGGRGGAVFPRPAGGRFCLDGACDGGFAPIHQLIVARSQSLGAWMPYSHGAYAGWFFVGSGKQERRKLCTCIVLYCIVGMTGRMFMFMDPPRFAPQPHFAPVDWLINE